ncbi:MAG: hypothetical protein KDJ15_07515 [Alphaproteobacteria bacterium]|nr:hypothetical protein [Alphaproteobacteria bacterium]
MPYLLLIFGVVLGLYGLYRFFSVATVPQIRALTMTAILVTLCASLFFLAVTGRLPAALALLAALIPLAVGWKRNKDKE